jgi:hypothetical protein
MKDAEINILKDNIFEIQQKSKNQTNPQQDGIIRVLKS